MGSITSKERTVVSDTETDTEQFNEKFTSSVPGVEADPELNVQRYLHQRSSETISADILSSWETDLVSNPKNLLAQNAIGKNDVYSVIADSSYKTKVKEQYLFNHTVDVIGSPAHLNNQKASGRCWLFATSNVLRSHVMKYYNLKDDSFQISQAYLFFYDKLEKANFFLDNIIGTADEELDSRVVQHLLGDPVSDGGQWDMVVNILNKYGAVPNEFFPDNAQATSSSTLNYVVKEKLREFALVLRSLKAKGAANGLIEATKKAMVQQIYNIIAISLGNPPKPDDKLVWEFIDKDGNAKFYETSPKDFYKTHVHFDAGAHFSLIHDPRHAAGKLYTVERLGNVSGGRPIAYVNTDLAQIKDAVIKAIKANSPVFFGCDVGKFFDRDTGVLDTNAYNFDLAFGTHFKTTKKERLEIASSALTHAMVITGVHLDPISGKPVRWKIENSWGPDTGNKGYAVMTDEWFDEYVFQVVSSKKFVDKSLYEVYKSGEAIPLPYYDPLGALA